MKNKTLFFVGLVTVLFGVQYCLGQSNVVFYGTTANSLGVSFVDTNLSVSAKASIVADLQLCLQEWGKRSELDLGAYEPGVVGYLYNFKRNPHYPEELEFPRKLITNGVPSMALQISNNLSDAYTNAFAFAAANSNIIVAAHEFVAFVSSSNFVAISSNDLPNYILYKDVPSNVIVCAAQTIIGELPRNLFPPSILGFYYSAEGPAATNLWVRIPHASNSYGGAVEWAVFPSAIWHDGKWKFCVWDRVPGVP